MGLRGLTDPLIVGEGPQPGVSLAVAVRAEQNALRELGFGPRPTSIDAVVRDRELLRVSIQVMKLKQRLGHDGSATEAAAA
jgi:hypothetical protein